MMMKIHTTQNLSSQGRKQSTNNVTIPEIRLNYSEQMRKQNLLSQPDTYESNVSFKGKKEIVTKAIEAGKRTLPERVANNKGIKKILSSDSFGKVLDLNYSQEVLMQAASALGICVGLRAGTIMLMSGKQDRQDSAYAAVHSISSGVWGFIVPLAFITPCTNAYNYALKNADKYVKNEKILQDFWPHLDIKNIRKADGTFKPMSEWVDRLGNKFVTGTKDVRKVYLPKHISQVSKETLREKFAGLDLASVDKTKSANNWLNKNGKKYELGDDISELFICIKKNADKNRPLTAGQKFKKAFGIDVTPKDKFSYYPLEHINPDLLKEVYPNLDLATVGGGIKNGCHIANNHPKTWKTIDGKPFKLDMDTIFVSNIKENEDMIPLFAGYTRKDAKGNVKDIGYLKNNASIHDLGTPVEQDMVDADVINTVQNKLGTWLPDLVVTYPRATATIAVLPFLLKHIFGIEKRKKPEKEEIKVPEIKMEPKIEETEPAVSTGKAVA